MLKETFKNQKVEFEVNAHLAFIKLIQIDRKIIIQ